MSDLTESYRKVQYDLRPAKQVERRMLIDALQLLAMEGFPIRDYQYTGMGSIYFIDYILFHKFLGLERLVSVEASSKITQRVQFNRPFGLVEVRINRVGDYIPELSRDLRHLLWLDYDSVLSAGHLQDIALAGTYLSSGSILLVTIDAEPPGGPQGDPRSWREYFEEVGGDYFNPSWGVENFARSKLARVNVDLIEKALLSGMAGRQHIEFFPLFNFDYADGHRMLTLGGMLGGATERQKIEASRVGKAIYFRGSLAQEPYNIRIPKLTRKERLFLDSEMPVPQGWESTHFELEAEDVKAYSEIYRFFPAYAELLI